MKAIKQLLAILIILSLVHCASAKHLQDKAPTEISEVYFQRWNSGIEEGNSGVNFYIKTAQPFSFDSLYRRKGKTKLKASPNNPLVHVASFKSDSKPTKTQSNTSKIVFQLKEDDIVVSYIQNGEVYYFKIKNITERRIINYPRSSSLKQ